MTMSASAMATLVMLLNVAFIVLILFGIVKLIQYLIRYGIDYYFKKLNAQKPSPSGEGGASAPDEGK